MVTCILRKSNYEEYLGLHTDKKPLAADSVPNGSKFTEIDSGKEHRYNAETDAWIEQGKPYPVKLVSFAEGSYAATYSDENVQTVEPQIVDGIAAYVYNGVRVACAAVTQPKTTKKAKK